MSQSIRKNGLRRTGIDMFKILPERCPKCGEKLRSVNYEYGNALYRCYTSVHQSLDNNWSVESEAQTCLFRQIKILNDKIHELESALEAQNVL